MDAMLKQDIADVFELVKTLPDTLQLRCMELLLTDCLSRHPVGKALPKVGAVAEPAGDTPPSPEDDEEELQPKDVHLKVRKFLEQQQLDMSHINQLFYKEGNAVKPLYDDLRTTKIAESQIRIALLQALEQSIQNGDFTFSRETVRQECQTRKCYDGANFAANFKQKSALFEEHGKETPEVRLSENGKKELANLIRALQ